MEEELWRDEVWVCVGRLTFGAVGYDMYEHMGSTDGYVYPVIAFEQAILCMGALEPVL